MGIASSILRKPFKSFNIESRAEKILNNKKSIPTPSYPSTAEQLRIAKETNPHFMEDHYKKDGELDDRLKRVFVASFIQHDEKNDEKSEKQLPRSRTYSDEYNYGFWEPNVVPDGRCHLKSILEFMTNYTTKSGEHTAQNIAIKYKLDLKDVENILEYYKVLQLTNKKADEEIAALNDKEQKAIEK